MPFTKPYTYVDGDFIQIRNEINEGTNKIESPYNSRTADKMTNREIRTLLSD